ncbi:hypothetical protein BDZ91DRAFT_796719 [Kalaharituber pfeilii]|nr:hypothetical protein BDZ91DRAFT_796719 [Kalaharituber pfeilii]
MASSINDSTVEAVDVVECGQYRELIDQPQALIGLLGMFDDILRAPMINIILQPAMYLCVVDKRL